MNEGSVEEGVIHMANAVFACDHPTELLQILQQTMAGPQFEALAEALPAAKIRQQNSVRGYMQSVSIIDVTNDAGDVGVEHRQPLGQLILDADDLE
ncbi:hypothetical protein Ddc_05883 [Ditylenchus destructor]|nr:hypothetical protein Ddc_05883 [Ditylenchus destructor]